MKFCCHFNDFLSLWKLQITLIIIHNSQTKLDILIRYVKSVYKLFYVVKKNGCLIGLPVAVEDIKTLLLKTPKNGNADMALTCWPVQGTGLVVMTMGYEIVFSLNCGIFNGNIWNSYLVLYMYMEKKSISLSGVLGSEFSDCDISYATAKVIIVAWLLDCHQATQPYHGTVQYTVVPR